MIYTFSGENSFTLLQRLKEVITAFLREHGDFGLEKLDGEEVEYGRMREACESLPFLASKKMVVLRTPGAQKKFQEDIEQLLKAVPDITDLIIIEPKLDKRMSYYKTLKNKTDFQQFNELDERGLIDWLVELAKQHDGTLSKKDASSLVARVGTNQQRLYNELLKLKDYDKNVTQYSIELLTEQATQSTIFKLVDAALSGNTAEAIRLYAEQRASKVEPQQIVAMLAWQLHVLALVRAAGDKPASQIASEAKLNPYVVRKSMERARSLSMDQLKTMIGELHQLDITLKSKSIDPDEALQNYILMIGVRK